MTKDNSKSMVIGVIADPNHADAGIDELKNAGYPISEISVITREAGQVQVGGGDRSDSVAEGALTGSATGGVIGGLAGLLIGVGAIAVPGIGPLLIGGPVASMLGLTGAAAATVSGAVTGALAGGLLGGLVALGLPEEEARVYEEKIKEGATFIAVPVIKNNEQKAEEILNAHGATEVKNIWF